jgi:hypothetical protein
MLTFGKLMLITIIIWRLSMGYYVDLVPRFRGSEPISGSAGGLDVTNKMESAPLCNFQGRGSPKAEKILSGLASAVSLGFEPSRNLHRILVSQIRHCLYLPVFISPRKRPSYTPRTWIAPPLSSPKSQSDVATDRQSVNKSWCRAPSGTHDEISVTV